MPAKKTKTPSEALTRLIGEYQINAFSLSKAIKINYQTILNIINGSNRITVQTAMKLGKYFGQSPEYWIDIQTKADIIETLNNKKFVKSLNTISKVHKPKTKPAAVVKQKTTGKTAKRKTLAEKRKKAAKAPGARSAKRKRKAK